MIERDWNDWDGLDAEIQAEHDARNEAAWDQADADYDNMVAREMEREDDSAADSGD